MKKVGILFSLILITFLLNSCGAITKATLNSKLTEENGIC